MLKIKWLLVILAFGLLAGCGIGMNTKGGSQEKSTENPKQNEAKFQSFIETKEENHSVIVNYKVKNVSGETQKLTFTSGLKADFIVFDQEGKRVKQYSDEVSSIQSIQEVTLENNEEIENEFTISDLYNGKFKIEVFLTAKEEQAKVVMELMVNDSLYSKGTGEYIGQMDPHSIEMQIEGEPVAFQLSKEAIQQLASLKEGDKVAFIFSENEIQKTIEKFLIK